MSDLDITGQRFGMLVVLHYVPGEGGKRAHWLCQCDCGNTKAVTRGNLRQGHVSSCGCKGSGRKRNHAMRNALITQLDTGEGYSSRKLSELTGYNEYAIAATLDAMEKEGITIKRKVGRFNLWFDKSKTPEYRLDKAERAFLYGHA